MSGVQIILGGSEILTMKTYHVSISVFKQPAEFAAHISGGGRIRELMDKYPPGTPFSLLINGKTQFDGKTDGWNVQATGKETVLGLTGRDSLAPIFDAFVDAEQTWTDVSIEEVVRAVFDKVLGDGDEVWSISASNATHRQAMSNAIGKKGKKTTKQAKKLTPLTSGAGGNALNEAQQAVIAAGQVAADAFTAAASRKNKKLQAKIGMRWIEGFLKPQLTRAGVFLWATEKNIFVLTELNADQPPTYRIRNRRGSSEVISCNYLMDTSLRYAKCTVHGRTGGGKESRTSVSGVCTDEEMSKGFGLLKEMHAVDDKSTTIEQCEFLAKSAVALSRRNGRKLSYVLRGHTTTQIDAENTVVWVPDTVVEIDDEELGIKSMNYIESVEHNGGPDGTTTTVNLMRTEDVVFGDGAGTEAVDEGNG